MFEHLYSIYRHRRTLSSISFTLGYSVSLCLYAVFVMLCCIFVFCQPISLRKNKSAKYATFLISPLLFLHNKIADTFNYISDSKQGLDSDSDEGHNCLHYQEKFCVTSLDLGYLSQQD